MGRDGVVDNESTLQVCAHHAGQWCGGVLVLLGLYILSRLVFSRPLSLSQALSGAPINSIYWQSQWTTNLMPYQRN